MKFPLSVALLLLSAFTLDGCLQDPIDGPQVFSRVVTSPADMYFFSPPASWNGDLTPLGAAGDLTVIWHHATTDTQLNFKAYYIRLYSSTIAAKVNTPDDITALLQTARVLKVNNQIDTSFTFKQIPYGRYTVMVNGEQFADSLTLSSDTAVSSNTFDPRPLQNPTNLRATSVGQTSIKLTWDLPATDKDSGLAYYRIFWLDTAATKRGLPVDSAYNHAPIIAHRGETSAIVTLQVAPTPSISTPQQERPYKFWIKSVRVDSVMFNQDSSVVTWAGADRLGNAIGTDSAIAGQPDSAFHGFRHSIFVGSVNGSYALIDDSVDNGGQLRISINGSTVTLTPQAGAKLLDHIDYAPSLDSIFYTTPYDSSNVGKLGYHFTTNAQTLDATGRNSGAVLYLEMQDLTLVGATQEYARIFVNLTRNGTYVINNSILVQASFQPGKTDDGTRHLPYY